METLRILVTGCSGFLGRYVAEQLTREGHEVSGFDLVTPSFEMNSFSRGDLTSITDVERAMKGINSVCHLGGVGDVYVAERDPALAFHVNGYGTKVVCDACTKTNVDRLIYASTWEVYGRPQARVVEEAHACTPESPYSISKLAGELLVRHVNEHSSLKATCLRLGTAYGARMRSTAVIRRFVTASLEGKSITIYGDGKQFRQFTHAADIAEAFSRSLATEKPAEVYNIVSKRRVQILELARKITAQCGGRIEFQSQRSNEPPSAFVSSELAKNDLGWNESLDFDVRLREVIEELESITGRVGGSLS